MDQVFEQHRVRAGDEGFQYDVEVDFENGKNVSGWDSNEEYSDPDFQAIAVQGQGGQFIPKCMDG